MPAGTAGEAIIRAVVTIQVAATIRAAATTSRKKGQAVQLDPDTFYVACVIADGRRHWSSPMQGRHCSSANVKRCTVEAIGRFLGSICFYDVNVADAIEVYALPSEPILTLDPAKPEIRPRVT